MWYTVKACWYDEPHNHFISSILLFKGENRTHMISLNPKKFNIGLYSDI